jgi:hypothetical protein
VDAKRNSTVKVRGDVTEAKISQWALNSSGSQLGRAPRETNTLRTLSLGPKWGRKNFLKMMTDPLKTDICSQRSNRRRATMKNEAIRGRERLKADDRPVAIIGSP